MRISTCWKGIFPAVLLVACVGAYGQAAQKIGFVRTDRIFAEANVAKAAQEKIRKEFQGREKEIEEESKQASSNEKRQILEVKKQAFVQDLSNRQKVESTKVIELANAAIGKVASS